MLGCMIRIRRPAGASIACWCRASRSRWCCTKSWPRTSPSAVPRKHRAASDFEAGFAAYDALDFAGAVPHFEAAVVKAPFDTVAALLLERARRFAADGSAPAERGAVRVEKAAAV